MIYEPAEDSYLLEKEVRKYAKGKRVLDIGSGSGIQALAARDSGASYVLATDVNSAVIRELKKKRINAVESDLFKNIRGKFDLVIFNPPYLPRDKREDEESERITSGGERGDEIIVRFLLSLGKHLGDRGIALIVLSSLTPKKRILESLRKNGLSRKIIAREKRFMEKLGVWK